MIYLPWTEYSDYLMIIMYLQYEPAIFLIENV